MSYPTDFSDRLEIDRLPTREAHLAAGLDFLAYAENAMVAQIRRGGGSVNPPHALAFATAHLLAAQVITAVEG